MPQLEEIIMAAVIEEASIAAMEKSKRQEEGTLFSPPKRLQQRALILASKFNKDVNPESTPKEDSNEDRHHLFTLEEDTNVKKQEDSHFPEC